MVTTAVAAAALSFDLAKLKFPAWSFSKAIGCHQWTMAYGDIRPIDLSCGSYRPGRRRAQVGLPRDGQRPLVRVA